MVLNSIGSNSLHHPAMATIQPNSKSSTLHLVFDALHAALTSDRSVFDECKFMSEKARRKSSVDKIRPLHRVFRRRHPHPARHAHGRDDARPHRAENGDRLDSYGHAPVSERPFRESVRRPVRARLCARGRVHGLAHRCVHRRAGEGESRVNKLSSCTFRVRPFWKRSSTIERTISPTLPPNARCFLSLHTHTFSIIIATSHFFIVSSSVFFF
ncbi:hypothetical protein BC938DRAFT_482998, partial [Jimgerdemannia flammicorona]